MLRPFSMPQHSAAAAAARAPLPGPARTRPTHRPAAPRAPTPASRLPAAGRANGAWVSTCLALMSDVMSQRGTMTGGSICASTYTNMGCAPDMTVQICFSMASNPAVLVCTTSGITNASRQHERHPPRCRRQHPPVRVRLPRRRLPPPLRRRPPARVQLPQQRPPVRVQLPQQHPPPQILRPQVAPAANTSQHTVSFLPLFVESLWCLPNCHC